MHFLRRLPGGAPLPRIGCLPLVGFFEACSCIKNIVEDRAGCQWIMSNRAFFILEGPRNRVFFACRSMNRRPPGAASASCETLHPDCKMTSKSPGTIEIGRA
jgi:hypothetical protein